MYQSPDDELKTTCPLAIQFGYEAYMRFRAYLRNVENEVGGLGSIEIQGQVIRVNQVYLIEQQVTAASTKLSPDGLAKFYEERRKANPQDDMASYKLWWHSHYNFGVFWSAIDDATIEDFDNDTQEENWFLSIVGNQKGDMRGRLDMYQPFRLTYDGLPVFIDEVSDDLETEVKKEIKEKVNDNYIVQNGLYDANGRYIGGNGHGRKSTKYSYGADDPEGEQYMTPKQHRRFLKQKAKSLKDVGMSPAEIKRIVADARKEFLGK